jgi:hypothetical protein
MKPATQEKIARALKERIERVLEKIAGDEPTARREVSEFFRNPELFSEKEPDDKFMRCGFKAGLALGLWSEVRKNLKEKPEPTKQELEKFLSELEGVDLEFMLRTSLSRMIRKLPPNPPGKQPKFKSQQRKEILAEVDRLSTVKGSRKEAYSEVAKKRGVHWRTIQNLLLKREHKDNSGGSDL